MKVNVYPADNEGCGHYRLIWPAQALAAQGADVTIHNDLDLVWTDTSFTRVKHVRDEADVFVFQRPLHGALLQVIDMLKRRGARIVVDMDDDFSNLHPQNPAFALSDPKRSPKANWRFLDEACRIADRVVVTTPALAKYGDDVVIVPNMVPERYLTLGREDRDVPVVGWAGNVRTHPGDLEQIGRFDGDLLCIGDGIGVEQAVPGVRVSSTGFVSIGEYPTYLTRLDVGLVPLSDSLFNRAKSALKMMEYAACGVVPIVSPTPDNLRMHGHGLGVVAHSPKGWRRHIRRLSENDYERREMSKAGRDVMSAFTIERHAQDWWDAWTA